MHACYDVRRKGLSGMGWEWSLCFGTSQLQHAENDRCRNNERVVGVVALLPFTNLSAMVRMLEAWEAAANHNYITMTENGGIKASRSPCL